MGIDLAIGIGGAAGQGIATPGDILARIFVRRGLNLKTYSAYQSIVRGGHILLTLRTSDQPVLSTGDRLDMLVTLNQDTMDRHLHLMGQGSVVLYNADKIQPGPSAAGVQLCPFSVKELAPSVKGDLVQNTIALAAILQLIGVDFDVLEDILTLQFQRKGQAAIDENVGVARAGYEHAVRTFQRFPTPLPQLDKPLAFVDGNSALAMGGAAAGVRFYCAYPMSPSTGVLHWMARHGQQLGIMVRQVEDELGVINMAIGAAHTGARAMCATSGGGFALMTEALGAASMMEIPVVCIDVQRAGPATGVPTKTEQGDLWQVLGAGQGDYPRLVVAPTTILDCFKTVPELFNLAERFQCPGIIMSDLLISEGRSSIDPADLSFDVPIDRGEVVGVNGSNGHANGNGNGHAADGISTYKRYAFTDSGVSPRAFPGAEGYVHVVATDEHDDEGGLISDEYTNPHKRQAMHEKRMRKMDGVLPRIEPPKLFGSPEADVTLVGWGSTEGVIREAIEQLAAQGVVANNLQIKWLVPLHVDAIMEQLGKARRVIIVENNYSGQFARYLRSETSFVADAHIRKYDGEPFMPHHIVDGVNKILAKETTRYVPRHEILV
ncbi:MAG: 2-oxoacid:acceptor oxidoreductase subunit alpha [Chloroflexi bacterium]|nr:2-oxoacid:acceptor oxidoreductase subunit alpha [Chloroflexota bacterium]MBV9602804.1 2-oxoacid:acceptor oxidoreductase subunit alpha [Chloroflexota bacterium]